MSIIFKDKLKNAECSTKTNEIENFRETLVILIEYIRKIQKEKNNDIKSYILSEFEELLKSYLRLGQNSLMQKELVILNIFKYNPHILKKYYELLKDEDSEKFDRIKDKEELKGNEDERAKYEMKVIIQEARTHKSIISPQMISKVKQEYAKQKVKTEEMKVIIQEARTHKSVISPQMILKVKQEYAKQKVKTEEMKEYYNYIIIFDQESEEEMIKMYVDYRRSELDKVFKKQEQQKLIMAGHILKKYGLLENDLQKMNDDYEVMEMPELKYHKRAVEEGDIGLEEIFEEEYVNGLNGEQLAILNTFWQNRLTKKLQFVNYSLLAIETLDLWEEILLGKDINLPDEKLRNIIYKTKICNSCYVNLKKDCIKDIIEENNIVVGLLNVNNVGTKFKEEYYRYFDKIFPKGRNNFKDDFSLGQVNRNFIENIYNTKNYKIEELLLDIETNRNITNWGYVTEKYKGRNSLQREKKNVIIAIDYPGFNNTLMIHQDRKQLMENFLRMKGRTVIPIYEGSDNSRYEGRTRARQVLMPLTEKRESAIIALNKNVNATDGRYQYITHLGNLITKKLRKKIKKIYPSRYVNLITGEEGYMINGKFVSEQEKHKEENDIDKKNKIL